MSSPLRTVLFVVGARPNFIKVAALVRGFRAEAPSLRVRLVHTGQHYDYAMNEAFFQQLEIPVPDFTLEVGSASHAVQTAEIMIRFEPILDTALPDCVVVVGDVNSTIACALVAAKKGVKVAHVEAGLRSRDRAMPEEINRVLTDQLSDRLYTTERSALANLVAEGIPADKVVFAGNVMVDTLRWGLERAVQPMETDYAVLTLHRPSNVDRPEVLSRLLETIADLPGAPQVIFPVHPRTRAKIQEAGLSALLEGGRIKAIPPCGYFEMLGLVRNARLVLTDSGGLQEETTALGIPCVTLRENTERPITLTEGTNTLVGTDAGAIRAAVQRALAEPDRAIRIPEGWDGRAANRIAADLAEWLER